MHAGFHKDAVAKLYQRIIVYTIKLQEAVVIFFLFSNVIKIR